MLEILKEQMKQGDALQQATGKLLMEMARRNPYWGEILSADLENEGLSLKAARDMLHETARKKKKGNFYGMEDEEAEKLLIDFYKLPETVEAVPKQEAEGMIDLLELL